MITGSWDRRRSSFNTSSPLDAPRLMSRTTRSGWRSSKTRTAARASCAAMGSRPARLSANARRSISSRSSSTSRIRTAVPRRLTQPSSIRQGEPDARTTAELTIDADVATVGFDDPLGDREAQSYPGRVGIRPHAIKTLKQSGLLFGRDARPLILDADAHHIGGRSPSHDPDLRLLGAVLRRVRQQVGEHLARITLVGEDLWRIVAHLDLETLAARFNGWPDDLEGVRDDRVNGRLARRDDEVARLDGPCAEQILHQRAHASGGATRRAHHVGVVGVAQRAVFGVEDLQRVVEHHQRSAQLVRDAIQELFAQAVDLGMA